MMQHENAHQPAPPYYTDDDLLTPTEAAKFMRLANGTLANWRCAGKGPRPIKLGGAVRYRFRDLTSFIAASTAEVA